MRLLITGGSGFLGRHLVKHYVSKGYRVGVAVRSVSGFERCKDLFEHVPVYIGNLANRTFVEYMMNDFKPESVIHAAACKYIGSCEEYKEECISSNITATIQVIETLRKMPEFISRNFLFISTDKANNPSSLYGNSKKVGEYLTLKYGGNVYQGVNFWASDGSFIRKWMDAIDEQRPITLNDPDHIRYFRYIDAVVDDIDKIITFSSLKGKIFKPKLVMKVRIGDVFDYLTRTSNCEYVIKSPDDVEKTVEEIDPSIQVIDVSVEELINNIPNTI